MNILFANNYFYLKGGSERVFFEEAELLKANNHTVSFFATQHENNLASPFAKYFVSKLEYKLKNVPRFIYCFESQRCISRLIHDVHPEIAHLHNIYQDISPSILPILKKNHIPVVLTLHDYKLICPNYSLTRNELVCEECRNGHFYKCLTNRCKGNYLHSAIPTIEAYAHNFMSIWKGNVSKFISPSNFLKNKFVDFGWLPEAVDVVPNFVELSRYSPDVTPGSYFLYLGRLTKEKGVTTLVNAFKETTTEYQLFITGSGPLEVEIAESVKEDKRIQLTGYLQGEQLAQMIRGARALIIPSEGYENAPMSVIEAMASGKPVIGAAIAGIPEMIDEGENGLLFTSGDAIDLCKKLELFLGFDDMKIVEMGKAARKKVEREYSAEMHYKRLMQIYSKVLRRSCP